MYKTLNEWTAVACHRFRGGRGAWGGLTIIEYNASPLLRTPPKAVASHRTPIALACCGNLNMSPDAAASGVRVLQQPDRFGWNRRLGRTSA